MTSVASLRARVAPLLGGAVAVAVLAGSASAQGRPFLFTVVPSESAAAPTVLSADVGYAERSFQPVGAERMEQAVQLQASVGGRLTLLARAGSSVAEGSARGMAQGELLVCVLDPAHHGVSLAVGGGAVRDYAGDGAVLARVSLGRGFERSRFGMNVLLERPLGGARDAVDVITTAGWMHRLGARAQLGVEAVGQDLEGFWEPDEAEGGARLFIGPTASLTTGPLTLMLGAGPVLHATRSEVRSDVGRPVGARGGYAVRSGVSFGW